MNREEIRKLIGGYATGNLSQAQRSALFAAVMEDQELFDALAREQPLADLLADPAARARLLAALGEPETSPWARLPWPALAACAAVAVVALVVFLPRGERREEAKPVEVAEARKEAAPLPPATPEPKPKAKHNAQPKPKREALRRDEPRQAAQPQPERYALQREEPRVMARRPAEAVRLAREAAQPDSAADAAGARPSVLARSSYLPGAESVLRSTVLRQTPDGGYEPLAKDASLRAGEAVRLRIEPAAAGYLHVLEREGQENWRQVFSGKVEAGRAYFVPAEGNMRLERPGRREFFVSLTGAEGPAPPMSKRVLLEVR